jgi:putative membrane protein insertion efficiency factor
MKLSRFLLRAILCYRKLDSPYFIRLSQQCIFKPTCSRYMMKAIFKYGSVKGTKLGIQRFLKCDCRKSNGGYDPLN